MKPLTVGALFAGYGGMEQGIAQVLPVSLSWFAEFDAAPSAVMAHHHPGVPNLGDVTKVGWSAVPRVDVITGGSPCQDLSHAGKRKGMTDGTRSNLWAEMREAVAVLRPRLVVWENVRGAYSAHADSDLEPCAGCVGGDGSDGEPVLRALGRVLGDLAELGYDARWYGLRAADVGGAHGRFRIFLFATPAGDAPSIGVEGVGSGGLGLSRTHAGPGLPLRSGADTAADLTLLPTPVADNSRGLPSSGTDYASLANVAVSLLPTPRATDGTKGGPNQRGSSGDLMLPSAVHQLLPTPRATRGGSATETTQLLPTPRTQNNENRQSEGYGGERGNFHGLANGTVSWGDYAPAIARWEAVLGRPAPAPTEPNAKGGHRLSPRFVEFLMGVPEGWVCDVPGITRNQALKALGNGIVPQQCAAAFRAYLTDTAREAIA